MPTESRILREGLRLCHPPDRSPFLDSKCVVTGADLDLVLLDPADLLYHSVSKSLTEL